MQIQPRLKQQVPSQSNTSLARFSSTIQRILLARGVRTEQSLDYGLKQLLPPSGLMHIELAAELLSEAIISQAKIAIVGDFDVDGATSVALAMRCLKAFGHENTSYVVPNRFEFGYGLSPEIVGTVAIQQPDVLITVDNGISSVDGVYAAQQLGMSVMITDHHLPGETLPTAEVIVNPNLQNDSFGSKNLAGVGVIFYVLLATRTRLRQMGWFQENQIAEPNMSQFLDLVALGTVADLVPLDLNNRILVQQGMQRIQQNAACAGIRALLQVGGKTAEQVDCSDLAFAVAPRLNAAGRMEDMSMGIACLLAESEADALHFATQLDEINQQRKQVEQGMKEDALAIMDAMQFDSDTLPILYVLYDATWHQGVVGLVASMVKEKNHRPALVLAPSQVDGEYKGSLRSIEGVHIRDLLARVDALYPDLLLKYGGHAMAAGLSIREEKLSELAEVLPKVAQQFCQDVNFDKVILSDGALNEAEFTIEFAQYLKQLSPWGQRFPEPLFDGEFTVLDARIVGEKHVKMRLNPTATSLEIDAIFFFYVDEYQGLPEGKVHFVYQLDVNHYRQQASLQLIVRHKV